MATNKDASKKGKKKDKEKDPLEQIKKFQEGAKKKALELHESHVQHWPFLVRFLLSNLVDVLDGISGTIPVVNVFGTFLSTFFSHIFWGKIGFFAMWEAIPEILGNLGMVGTGPLTHAIAVWFSAFPSVTVCGIIWLVRNWGGTIRQRRPQAPCPPYCSREWNPALKEAGCKVLDKLGWDENPQPIEREWNPVVKKIIAKIKSW